MKFEMCVPLLGFESTKKVELLKIDDVFMKMQSVTDNNISFTLINPFVLREYDFEVSSNIQELLGINENSNLVILNIVIVQTPIENSMINFAAPIIFNTDTKKAAQVIISNSDEYGITEKISDFLNKRD